MLREGSDIIDVHHGPWVEAREKFFAEGAWNLPFSAGDLADASVFMGSGAQITDDGVIFASPTHTLDRLHYLKAGPLLIVSNSLSFTLSLANDSIAPLYAGYSADLSSFTRGIRDFTDRIPTRDGRKVHLEYYTNLLVTHDHRVRRMKKKRTTTFRDFAGYVAVLRKSLTDVHANASSSDRGVRYSPLATLSSGYDSPACAVLARDIQCTEAVTFSRARESFDCADDSGKDIGAILGLDVLEFERDQYLHLDGFPEAEFLATGTGGDEIVFAPLEEHLRQRMLITGYKGDSVWDRKSHTANDECWMRYPGGSSLTEFRLRVGFIHFPLPIVCYLDSRDSVAISNSSEMVQWSIGGDYDRPIPRRIVEESGVPRHLFGQQKKAVTQNVANEAQHSSVTTAATARDFSEFARDLPPDPTFVQKVRQQTFGLLYAIETRILWRREARAIDKGRFIVPRRIVSGRYRRSPTKGDFTFHWAMSKIEERYRVQPAAESHSSYADSTRSEVHREVPPAALAAKRTK